MGVHHTKNINGVQNNQESIQYTYWVRIEILAWYKIVKRAYITNNLIIFGELKIEG